MSRKPKDDVAASRTASLRLTPEDRARVDRVIEARAHALPERTLSALFRRLLREAEEDSPLLPAEERGLLGKLVAKRSADAARIGAVVTPQSLLCALVRDAARAEGIEPGKVPAPSHATEAPPQVKAPEPKAAQKAPEGHDAASVRAALMAALDAGNTQADIARQAGLDGAHVSRFKAKGSGLSGESLTKLAKALGMKTP